jgi:hypothetical protein
MRRSLLTLLFVGSLAATGCGPKDDMQAIGECQKACIADLTMTGAKVCGTDRATHDACDADCGALPKGVGFYPGECQPDGSPAPGSPSVPADGDNICDYVKVAGRWIAVECSDDLDDPVSEVGTILGDPDGSDFAASGWSAPAEVDHRSRFVAPKDQGQAGTCTAFGMTAALESAVRATVGEKLSLSEMHLWARYHQPYNEAASEAAQDGGIVTTAEATAKGLPYKDSLARDWLDGKSKPDPMLVDQLDALAKFEVAAVDVIAATAGKKAPTAEQIRHALAAGLDVYIGMSTHDNWSNPSSGAIADYEWSGKGGHALLIVGYKNVAGRPHFILRNSWGADWADQGYAYIPADTLERNLTSAFTVAVRRLDGPDTSPSCAAGEAADLAGDCRKVCADGALADPVGSCEPTSATCAAGLVADAGGQCVAACASMPRTYPGMRVECRDRACTWHVDHGVMGCNAGTGKTCDKTCPAPTCGVVTRQNELGQTVWGCAAAAQ